jgi:hypothetical protein
MSYTAYESRSGEVLDRVQAICRQQTTAGKFTDSTTPPLTDVEQWITDSYYSVIGDLLYNGFGTTTTDPITISILSQIQALWTARMVQLSSRSGITEPDQKLIELKQQYNDLVRPWIMGGKLADLGMSRTRPTAQTMHMTGSSESRRTTALADSDRIRSRFPRGFGQQTSATDRDAE